MHITASVFINDDEQGLHANYEAWLERLAPHEPVSSYRHNLTGEDNADAHMKRQIMGREVLVAIEFGLGQIEPTAVFWRVMPFEALDQPPGLGGRECLIEGSFAVDVEVVLDQDDDLGVGEVGIGEVFQDMSIIHGSVSIGDLDVAPAFERREHHEQVGVPLRWYS